MKERQTVNTVYTIGKAAVILAGGLVVLVVLALPHPASGQSDDEPVFPVTTIAPEQRPTATAVPPDSAPETAAPTATRDTLLPMLPPAPGVEIDEEDGDDDQPNIVRRAGCNAAPQPANPPRFLSLPFPADPQMEVYQGWHYTSNNQAQCGIDYTRRDPGTRRITGFPITASADGEACADLDGSHYGGCVSGFGHRVLIRHNVDGETYYTYYGHLDKINPDIPIGNRGNTIRVRRGEIIGYAGDTGAAPGDIHLHFGIASPNFGWYDPYGIFAKAVHYPDPNGINGLYSEDNTFWTTNPPSNAIRPDPVGGPEASIPADTITAGTISLSEWTHIMGRHTGVVEVWINGERRGEADFGPRTGDDRSIFTWEWDTSQERNGPHQVKLVAFAEDSSVTPLFEATEAQEASFLVSVQNPWGFVEAPATDTVVQGTTTINGWAMVAESTIREVEIWVDGEKQGSARYGLPHRAAGGDYGFTWELDTTALRDGVHTVVVKAIAENGGRAELPTREDVEVSRLHITVENRDLIPKWTIR